MKGTDFSFLPQPSYWTENCCSGKAASASCSFPGGREGRVLHLQTWLRVHVEVCIQVETHTRRERSAMRMCSLRREESTLKGQVVVVFFPPLHGCQHEASLWIHPAVRTLHLFWILSFSISTIFPVSFLRLGPKAQFKTRQSFEVSFLPSLPHLFHIFRSNVNLSVSFVYMLTKKRSLRYISFL